MNLTTKCGQAIKIRWMIARDLPEVLEIERASFSHPWDESDFVKASSDRQTSIMVAEHSDAKRGDRIVGFVVYHFSKPSDPQGDLFDIIDLAVCPFCRRLGVGRMLVENLIDKLAHADAKKGRKRLRAAVWEGNTAGQLFLRAMGMRCVAILKDAYKSCAAGQDAYLFTRGKEVAATLPQEVL